MDGRLPKSLGDRGGHVVAGFNAPNRVVLTEDAEPGRTFTIAVFGINGPISARPENYLIRVNRQPCPRDQILREGDRVSFTPVKIEGA